MARWPAYAAALPVSRGKVVLSKYALGMGMPLLGGVIALLITVGYSFIRPENMVEEDVYKRQAPATRDPMSREKSLRSFRLSGTSPLDVYKRQRWGGR